MHLIINVKQVESQNGGNFNVYSTRRQGKWWNVRFVKDLELPKVVNLGKDGKHPIPRMIIHVPDEEFDIGTDRRGYDTLWVRAYDYEGCKEVYEQELKRIAEYREKHEAEKRSFAADETPPTEVDTKAKGYTEKPIEPVSGDDLPF